MKKHALALVCIVAIAAASALAQQSKPVPTPDQRTGTVGAKSDLDRTILPIADPSYPPIAELDVRNAQAPPRFEVRAPKDAPNVLVGVGYSRSIDGGKR